MQVDRPHPSLTPLCSQYFSLRSGHRLHYVEAGQGEDVWVCVHGNPTWSFYFRPLLLALQSRCRILAVDHLGCGLSDKPQDAAYRLQDHCRNLTEWLDGLGLSRITLVVHDWGGAIGLGAAVSQPERIQRLIITNSAAFASIDIPKRIALCRIPWLGEWAMRRWNLFARAACYMATKKGLTLAEREGLLAPYGSYADRVAIARFVQDIPLESGHPSFATLQRIESKLPLLAAARVPVLFLWGMQDFCFHTGFLSRWREFFPYGEVCEFPTAGHYLFIDAMDACVKRIETFLAKEEKAAR